MTGLAAKHPPGVLFGLGIEGRGPHELEEEAEDPGPQASQHARVHRPKGVPKITWIYIYTLNLIFKKFMFEQTGMVSP